MVSSPKLDQKCSELLQLISDYASQLLQDF